MRADLDTGSTMGNRHGIDDEDEDDDEDDSRIFCIVLLEQQNHLFTR